VSGEGPVTTVRWLRQGLFPTADQPDEDTSCLLTTADGLQLRTSRFNLIVNL